MGSGGFARRTRSIPRRWPGWTLHRVLPIGTRLGRYGARARCRFAARWGLLGREPSHATTAPPLGLGWPWSHPAVGRFSCAPPSRQVQGDTTCPAVLGLLCPKRRKSRPSPGAVLNWGWRLLRPASQSRRSRRAKMAPNSEVSAHWAETPGPWGGREIP